MQMFWWPCLWGSFDTSQQSHILIASISGHYESQNFSNGNRGLVNGKLGYCHYVKKKPSDNNEKN